MVAQNPGGEHGDVIFNHGQVTWTTPELAPPLLTTTPHQREHFSALEHASLPYTHKALAKSPLFSDFTELSGFRSGSGQRSAPAPLHPDIREEITVDSGRKMLIEKRDVHNIKREFNINGYVKRNEIDAVSVKLWAEEKKNNGENCIVYFKEQGQSGNDYCLIEEDFVLVIMTDFQKEVIKKYGKDKICIDGTLGLNTHTHSYDFNLYSVLVVDEHKNGIPVAFCFSNRSTEEAFRIYFSAIQNAVGKIETTIFMTDDAPAF
ncbi:MULE domain-containing protein [Trichonephila clavipes]|nr:MULE domain-containing protein [Trichonephila clavipes]